MTVKEAAEKLGHKFTSRVYDLIKKKVIKATETKEQGVVVDADSVNEYMKNRRVKEDGTKKERKVRSVPKPSKKKKQEAA